MLPQPDGCLLRSFWILVEETFESVFSPSDVANTSVANEAQV